MEQAQHGMLREHARSGVAHHGFHLIATRALIAMNRAIGACGFFRTEAAALQPEPGVSEESFAFVAATDLVMCAAIDPNHRRHGFPFTGKPLVREQFCRRRLGNEGDAIAGRSAFHAVEYCMRLDVRY